jgi:Kef-type K+ transport system membrane component KefB
VLWPDGFGYVFQDGHPAFAGLAPLGLVLLVFQIGLDLDVSIGLESKRTVVLVSALGIAFPFALGLGTAGLFHDALAAPRPPRDSFTLIFAVSMSITALPVLGRIFTETGLATTRAGTIAIGAAAIDDLVGWLLLGIVSLLVAGDFSVAWIGMRLAGLVAIGSILVWGARPLLLGYFERHFARHARLEPSAISVVLVVMFGFALATSHFGLHALIGGFMLGVALHTDARFVTAWKARVVPIVNTLFLPVFFALTGLRTDVGSLHGVEGVVQCALICGVAFLGKYGGGYLGARLAGEPPRIAHVLAISMNTRGLMELVVLNIGYDLGVLPRALFTQLVVMAIFTTLIATPLIRRYMRVESAAGAAAS